LSSKHGTVTPTVHVLEVIGNAIIGGVEMYVHNLVQLLPLHGFKVTCLAPYESPYTAQLRQLGCEVYITEMDVNVPWRSLQFATELARHLQVDLLHAHLPRAHALAGLAGNLTRRPVAATFHGMEFNIEELGIAQMTGTHVVTVCQKAYLQGLGLGIPAQRLSMIPNGVDCKKFTPANSGLEWRQKHNIPLDVPLAGFAGRLAYEKGPDLFIQFASSLHRQLPQVHYVLVGEGPMEGDVRRLIAEHELEGVVHLAGLNTDMSQVYPAFDIQVMTSRYEGMPFALLEGMACGVPSAALSVGGVAEIIEVGATGITATADDWEGLAGGVARLLVDTSAMRRMGAAARRRVEQHFDLHDSIAQTASLFRALVQSGAIPAVDPAWVLPHKSALGK